MGKKELISSVYYLICGYYLSKVLSLYLVIKRSEEEYKKDIDKVLYKKLSMPTEHSKIQMECKNILM